LLGFNLLSGDGADPAELAFAYCVERRPPWFDRSGIGWDSATCGGSITDQGTAGRPAYGQPGHAAGCEHLAADIATWSEASA
jgi:hypothetical protein